ncbi:hypothetical protein AB4144_61640, partial [Rhizobiaceae sp. 2RAB30]
GEVLSAAPRAPTIITLAGAGLAAVVFYLLLTGAATVLGHKIAFAIQRELRLSLLRRIERMPVGHVEGKAGEVKKILLGDVDRLEGLLAHVIPDMVAGLT